MSDNDEMRAAWDGPEGAHWAEHDARYQATSPRFHQALFDALDLRHDSAVLDIGCGTGASTIRAGRIAATGSVLGVDLSSQMLEKARTAAAAEGLGHVRFEHADAQVHPFEAGIHDTVISCFGGMFFADPIRAFTNIRRASRPDASLALIAWRDLERNDWINAMLTALAAGRVLPPPPPGAQGPFSMADPDITTERLHASGYRNIELTSVDEAVFLGSDADDAYSFVSTLGFTRGLTADLDEATRSSALEQLHRTLEDHETTDGVTFDGSAWLITATNSEAS